VLFRLKYLLVCPPGQIKLASSRRKLVWRYCADKRMHTSICLFLPPLTSALLLAVRIPPAAPAVLALAPWVALTQSPSAGFSMGCPLESLLRCFDHAPYMPQVDSKYSTEPAWVTGTSQRFKANAAHAVRMGGALLCSVPFRVACCMPWVKHGLFSGACCL